MLIKKKHYSGTNILGEKPLCSYIMKLGRITKWKEKLAKEDIIVEKRINIMRLKQIWKDRKKSQIQIQKSRPM